MAMVDARGNWLPASTMNVRSSQNARRTPRAPPNDRKNQALGNELTGEIAESRTKGQADPQLAPAREAGGEQQVGDVRASNQQHRDDGAEQHPQLRPDRTHDYFPIRLHVDAVVVAELLRECHAERAHFVAARSTVTPVFSRA